MRENSLKKILTTLLLMVVCHQDIFAQTKSVVNFEETGLWSGFYIKTKFTDKIGYYGEHNFRQRNSLDNLTSFVGRTRQIYNRAGLNIFFNKYFEVVIGPTLVLNYTPEPGNDNFQKVTVEPRIWHQWLFIMPPMSRFTLYHQFRFEHRWKRSNLVNSEYKYSNRYRYKFFAYIPINKKTLEKKTFYFSPSAEIFLQSGKSIINNPLEDFRTYNGFGYILNNNITFFAGHMWTIGQKNTGFEYRTSHVIRLNVMIGLDLRKLENKLPQVNLGY